MIKSFNEVVTKLSALGIKSPRLEARLLIAAALSQNPSEVSYCELLDNAAGAKIELWLNRRAQHEPLDKILGRREFYKYDFIVNRDVLSPRPETEVLVEKALLLLQNIPNAKILDLGTGSGCIIETLLAECPNACGVGVDISAKALKVAAKNAQKLQVADRLRLDKQNWFDKSFCLKEKFDLVVSNPPYIKSADILKLDAAVKDYDPLVALDGGINGLSSYKKIAEIAPNLLKDGGYILLETGAGQAQDVVEIFSQHLRYVDVVKDLAQIERCVIMQKFVAQ